MINEKILIEKLEEEKQRLQKLKNDTITLTDREVITIEEMAYDFCKKVAIDLVEDLSEECNNGWIPCEERLPKECETVLGYEITGYCQIVRFYKDKIFGKVWRVWNGGTNSFESIIAWQPLPAPYQKEVQHDKS